MVDFRRPSHICLTATLTDNHRLMHCYQIICQIAKKLLLKGGKFVLGWLVGVSILHVCARSPNLTIKTLTNIKCNTCDVMQLYQCLGGEVLI